jgi:hypothetical protein
MFKHEEKVLPIMEASDHTPFHVGEVVCADKRSTHALDQSALNNRGMRLLFLFLVNETYLNRTDRAIARMTGLSEGQVHTGRQQLIRLGMLDKSEDRIQIADKRKLLDLWIINYGRLIRSSLILGTYICKSSIEEILSQKLLTIFPNDRYAVGGVLGSDILVPFHHKLESHIYIKPEDLELVEHEFSLVPSKESNFTLFHLFSPEVIFHNTLSKISVAQPLLIYAELLHKRLISAEETESNIYDQYLENNQ